MLAICQHKTHTPPTYEYARPTLPAPLPCVRYIYEVRVRIHTPKADIPRQLHKQRCMPDPLRSRYEYTPYTAVTTGFDTASTNLALQSPHSTTCTK